MRRGEQVDVLEDGAGLDELRIAQAALVDAARAQLVVREGANRVDAVREQPPQLVDGGGTGPPSGQADDRDVEIARVGGALAHDEITGARPVVAGRACARSARR